MAGARYLIHGLVVAADWDLPIEPIDDGVQVDIEFVVDTAQRPGTTARPSFTRVDDPDDPYVCEHWVDGRLAVEFPDSATFEVRTDLVLLVEDHQNDPDLIAHLLLDAVIPRVIALRGDLMLHASGVVGPSGRAHLFLGRTSAGKSTLAAALAVRGWPLLDDDAIRVIFSADSFFAMPGYAGVRLLSASAEVVVPAVAGRPMTRGHDKQRFALSGTTIAMASAATPIAAIYRIERNARAFNQARLRLGDALTALTEHGFHIAEEPADIARRAFESASAVAAAVPVIELQYWDGFDRLDEVAALLTDLDDELHRESAP